MLYGELKYGGKTYRFQLDGYELSIHCVDVPLGGTPMSFLVEGIPPIDEVLLGTCYPEGYHIAIYVNGYWRMCNNVLSQTVRWYFRFSHHDTKVSAISISADELNEIFPIRRAISERRVNEDPIEYGLTIKPFNSSKYEFQCDGKRVECQYTMRWSVSNRNVSTPIHITSNLTARFGDTDDYHFCSSVIRNLKIYVEYMCCRRNISINSVRLMAKSQTGRYCECGEFFAPWLVSGEKEKERVIAKKFIPEEYLGECNSTLLQHISDGKIYLRHIPQSDVDGKVLTPARFVMLTAAFEWEYRQLFPDGVPHKTKTINERTEADKVIADAMARIESSRVRKILETVKDSIHFDNLESKIIHACRELDECVRPFGEYMFQINDCEFNPENIGKELSKQRNNFAHGNLDKEFSLIAALGVSFLQDLIYAMQLTGIGVSKDNIKKAINSVNGYHLL